MKKAKSNVDVSSLQDDINMKAAFKYNPILEQQVPCIAACLLSLTKASYKAKNWVEQVLEVRGNTLPFYETFKDGVLLCR